MRRHLIYEPSNIIWTNNTNNTNTKKYETTFKIIYEYQKKYYGELKEWTQGSTAFRVPPMESIHELLDLIENIDYQDIVTVYTYLKGTKELISIIEVGNKPSIYYATGIDILTGEELWKSHFYYSLSQLTIDKVHGY